MRHSLNKSQMQRKFKKKEKSTCKKQKKLVTYLNVVRREIKNSSRWQKQIQKSSWQELESLIKYKSRLVQPDGGSTLKTEQSFAKSVRV